ncbi:MAG TPA: PilZ domain-containing protein [Allosphingosinicella sp.]
MHGLRSRILAGEAAAGAPGPDEEACRRKGERDPSRAPSDRVRDDRRVAAQRKAKRLREVASHATVWFGGKRSLVAVVNVSPSGLTIESAVAPKAGEAVTVALEGREPVEGIVRWVRRGRVGIDVGEGRIRI